MRPVVDAGLSLNPRSFTWWALRTWIESCAGDRDAAQASLDGRPTDDLAAADAGYLWLIAAVVAVSATTMGDRRWAQAAYDTLAPYSGRNAVLGYVAYLGAVDHHLGTLAAVLGRTAAAAEHLGAALERHRVIEARPWVALSAAWLANVLIERDARDATGPRGCRPRPGPGGRPGGGGAPRPTPSSAVEAVEVLAEHRKHVGGGVAADERVEVRSRAAGPARTATPRWPSAASAACQHARRPEDVVLLPLHQQDGQPQPLGVACIGLVAVDRRRCHDRAHVAEAARPPMPNMSSSWSWVASSSWSWVWCSRRWR